MADAFLDLLKAFNFTEMQTWIAVISALLFTACLLGGMLSALTFIYSKQLQRRPLGERISFRLLLLCEFILWVFVFFYHVFMIEKVIVAHMIYWMSATMMLPLLAVIGSQIMQVTFSAKIKVKEDLLKRQRRAVREQRRKTTDDSTDNPAERALSKRHD